MWSNTSPDNALHSKPKDKGEELQTATIDEFLPPLGIWTKLSGLFMLAGFGSAVALASIAQYKVVVKAPAIVRPAGELRLVQAAMEGTVKQIAVQENQFVRQGDAIAILEDSQLQTKASQLRGNIQHNQLQLSQIAAGLGALDAKINAETTAMQRSITSAQAELSRNQRDYQDLQIGTETEVKEAKAALSLAQDELNRYLSLGQTGAVTKLQIKEKESAAQTAQARLERAMSKLNPSHATVTLAQERIALAKAQGKSILASLSKEREASIQEQLNIKSQIDRDQKDLKQVEIEQQKAIVRSPKTGTILKLELRNPGQVVRPGDTIAQIAPNENSLLIKARVAASDVANVKVCTASQIQNCREGKVFLRVSAYPYTDYGTLTGAVRAIAPDATTSQGTNAAPYYEVTISPEKLYLERNHQQYPIQAGMEVSAEIVAHEETILRFILRKARLLTNF
ncbi:HlyD family secretion protein [Calothrix sp. NIES-2098]|uniref:HlyD family secretion protein n=1 Tax=Calothrix sp. NIES-2098 TaxID=1954171 RepID=UPI000B60C3B1|nr:secretion protein HlyD [Calothrix sp. NIES-2098]